MIKFEPDVPSANGAAKDSVKDKAAIQPQAEVEAAEQDETDDAKQNAAKKGGFKSRRAK